ncbi:hypothetical protein ACS8YF_16400 [Salinisphaera sp. SWV1]|uniref:hypothetical protein n=1 Tax=Salinisphaera sp. SWV1 TaxID=3454139 RepID=UPI003F84C272
MNKIEKVKARLMGRRAMVGGLVLLLAAVLGGCAGSPNCLTTQRYENAKVFPKLKSPAGLKIPKPDPDMKIPSVPNGPVAAYSTAPQGTDASNPQSRCLTTPPPLGTSS